MGVIVAAPTAGAAPHCPAPCLAVAEEMGLSDEMIVRAMLAGGLIGVFIASRWTFAAEVGGCQAEGGAAACMAAAVAGNARRRNTGASSGGLLDGPAEYDWVGLRPGGESGRGAVSRQERDGRQPTPSPAPIWRWPATIPSSRSTKSLRRPSSRRPVASRTPLHGTGRAFDHANVETDSVEIGRLRLDARERTFQPFGKEVAMLRVKRRDQKRFYSRRSKPQYIGGRRGIKCRPMHYEILEPRHLLSGVTLITHGFNSSVDDWVTAMADAIAARPDLSSDQPRYRVEVTNDNGSLSVANTSRSGPAPADCTGATDIVILLNWTEVAGSLPFGGNHRSTVDVAAAVAAKLPFTQFSHGSCHARGRVAVPPHRTQPRSVAGGRTRRKGHPGDTREFGWTR